MYGIVIIVLLIVLSGLIAYLGDQIGMKVGKNRISIFGLRPRYSSIIITIITGIFIAGLSIIILLTVYGSLREALFNINRVVLKLETLNEKLTEKDNELSEMKNEISAKSEELSKLQSQKNDLEIKLGSLQNELAQVQGELKDTEAELGQARDDIASLKENRNQLQARISELNSQRNELESRVTTLNSKISELSKNYEVASELANKLGEDMYYYMKEDIVYQKGDTIYADVIEGGRSEDETIKALNQFLTKANGVAKKQPIKSDENTGMALELQTEDILYTARVLYNMEKDQQVIVSLVSSVNVPKNEWLKANFVLNKNFIVFSKGDFIAKKVIDADNPASFIDKELRELLADVNKTAIKSGLLTDSEGQVGSIDFINFYQVLEKVKDKEGKIKVSVYSNQDIWRNNRLGSNIRFTIEKVEADQSNSRRLGTESKNAA